MRKVSGVMIVVMSFVWGGCNAIFEKDISAEVPEVIIPVGGDTVFSNQVHFKWEEMEGARNYNLQIVTPSFDDIDQYVLDSLVSATEFYQILAPGFYEYRLRGENAGYESLYTEALSFYVDSTSDLSGQFVLLLSPTDNVYVNGSSDVTVAWQSLFSASEYEYVLRFGGDFDSGSTLDFASGINTLSYTISSSFFGSEGMYHWGILGRNESSSSAYASRTILVDMTRPNDPELISPSEEETVSEEVEVIFKWTTGIDPGTVNSPVTATVEISPTESFIDFEAFEGITADSLGYTFSSPGSYWWRVKTEDEAGNVSEFYSEEREIIVE